MSAEDRQIGDITADEVRLIRAPLERRIETLAAALADCEKALSGAVDYVALPELQAECVEALEAARAALAADGRAT